MQFARLCNCPQSIKLLEIMPQNIKLLVKSARFATESLYSQNKKPSTQKDERHIFLQDGYACAASVFSAIVQGGDHIDRLIHRVALVADGRAASTSMFPLLAAWRLSFFEQLRGQNRAFELQNEGWESPRFQPWDDRPTIMVFFVSTNIIVM